MKIKRLLKLLPIVFLIPVFLLFGCYSEKSAYKWCLGIINQYYYEDLPSDYQFNGSVKEFVEEYLDDYSAYYTKSEYQALYASNAGNKSGIGVSYMYVAPEDNHPEGKSGVLLEKIVGNSPAYKAGLKAGEFVYGATVDGEYTQFTSDDDFSDLISKLGINKQFTLKTDRGEYSLAKENYTASYCSMATNSADYTITYEGYAPVVVSTVGGKECLPDGVAYLRLDQFYGKAFQEMTLLMEQFNAQNCTSLILDLRGNGGGYVDVMSNISAIYTGQLQNPLPKSMFAKYKNGTIESTPVGRVSDEEMQLPSGTRVSVLADNGTASASEALLGVLICNGVIDFNDVYISDFSQAYLKRSGTENKDCRTYGKGIMQATYIRRHTGDALKLTTAKIYWPDEKTCIHDVGLNADMGCNLLPAEWDVTYSDEQLSLAVKAIYGTEGQ